MVFLKCLEEMKREARTIKIDRRLTGANIIDEPLQQVSSSVWYLSFTIVVEIFLLQILRCTSSLFNVLKFYDNAVFEFYT